MTAHPTTDCLALAFGADENFAMPLAVALYGALARLDTRCEAEIFIVDGGFKPETRRRIAETAGRARSDVPVTFLTPGLSALEGLPSGKIGVMAYLRLLLPDTIPQRVSHVAYLDCDLLIQGDLSPLRLLMPHERAIAACREWSAPTVSSRMGLPNWRELGLPSDAPYLNSGVLLMNLTKWRAEGLGRRVMQFCAANRAINRFADQDGINSLLSGDCDLLDPEWNVPAYIESTLLLKMLQLNEPYTRTLLTRRHEFLRTAPVIHFIGGRKPWNCGLGLRSQHIWLRQLWESQWFSGVLEFASFAAPIAADSLLRRAVRRCREVFYREVPIG